MEGAYAHPGETAYASMTHSANAHPASAYYGSQVAVPASGIARSSPLPTTAEGLLLLDLDLTMLHMVKADMFPDNAVAAGLVEDVIDWDYGAHRFKVAIRVGATRLVKHMQEAGVHVHCVTCNLHGDHIVEKIASVIPSWKVSCAGGGGERPG